MNRFDEVAGEWDSRPEIVERNRIIGAELAGRISLNPDMNVLDYGAGTGLMSLFIAEMVSSVTAADTSQGMLDVLSEKLTRLDVKNIAPMLMSGSGEFELRGPYDLIFTGMTLHHVEHINAVLESFNIACALDGWLAIADLAAEDGSFHGERDDVHYHGFDENELTLKLEGFGFTDITSRHVHSMRRGHGKEQREFPVFLMIARRRK